MVVATISYYFAVNKCIFGKIRLFFPLFWVWASRGLYMPQVNLFRSPSRPFSQHFEAILLRKHIISVILTPKLINVNSISCQKHPDVVKTRQAKSTARLINVFVLSGVVLTMFIVVSLLLKTTIVIELNKRFHSAFVWDPRFSSYRCWNRLGMFH